MVKRKAPTKPSRKPVSPSGFNEYCYKITGKVGKEEVTSHLEKKVYRNPKFSAFYKAEEDLPLSFLFPKSGNIVCIKMNSKAQKHIERIEEIHKKLGAKELSFSNIVLSRPEAFMLEQCNWWGGECKFGEVQKWKTLSHNGPYFKDLLEPYTPHKAPLIYAGKKYALSPKEEKAANYYARRVVSERSPNITVFYTRDVKGKGKDKIFNENFWKDFRTYLTPEHKSVFTDWRKADFGAIADKLEEIKASETKEDKKRRSEKVAEIKHDYGYAEINGITEPLGNFTVEPASLFLGRGDNPKRGKIKREILPEDVTINIGKTAKIPKAPKGHEWGGVVHDQEVEWIASWKDTITGEPKYVSFAAEGQLKGKSDFKKYAKARKLNHFIKKVRAEYTKDINSDDLIRRQLGTVIYLIDHYGLRAGGEKGKDETDTVGASTLRVEHIKLKAPDVVVFDFLGKDSVRYYKEIKVDKAVYKNIADFLKNKHEGAQLFNKISASDINNYLKTFDKSFTAKVFRTRLASVLMYDELKKVKLKKGEDEADKKLKFDKANVAVAETLNHQRTVSAKNEEAIKKLKDKLKELKKELKTKKAEGRSTDGIQKRIATTERNIESKGNTLNVAITTSRANYIDPRIIVSWCLENDLDISKVYTAPNQKKFRWAIDTTEADWDYLTSPLPTGMDQLNPVDTVKPKPGVERSPRRKSVGKRPVESEEEDEFFTEEPVFKAKKKKISKRKAPEKKVLATEKKPKPAKEKVSEKKLEFHDFSGTAFIVFGGSDGQKKIMRSLGGVVNPKGFVFKKGREDEIKKALSFEAGDPLVSFYLSGGRSFSGYTLDEILSWDKLKLEQRHDFIQTLFPLATKSKYAPGAPTLTPEALKEFQTNDVVRYNVYLAYMKMMDFYGYDVDLKNRTIARVSPLDYEIDGVTCGLMSGHNYLRISRMLTFLQLAHFELLGLLFFLGLCRDLKTDGEFRDAVLSSGSLKHWMIDLGIPETVVENYDEEKLYEKISPKKAVSGRKELTESVLIEDRPAQRLYFEEFAKTFIPEAYRKKMVDYIFHIHPEDRLAFMEKIQKKSEAERLAYMEDLFGADEELEGLAEEVYEGAAEGVKEHRDLYDYSGNSRSALIIYKAFLRKVEEQRPERRGLIYLAFTGASNISRLQEANPEDARKMIWENFFIKLNSMPEEERRRFIDLLFDPDFDLYKFVERE